jgi:hypothetical protein
MNLKQGVDVRGVQPEILLGLEICHYIFTKHGVPLTITAVTDGKHMSGSLHYKGQAVDIRLPSRYSQEQEIDLSILVECREALGDNFDIVLESDHLHLEFDHKVAPLT